MFLGFCTNATGDDKMTSRPEFIIDSLVITINLAMALVYYLPTSFWRQKCYFFLNPVRFYIIDGRFSPLRHM